MKAKLLVILWSQSLLAFAPGRIEAQSVAPTPSDSTIQSQITEVLADRRIVFRLNAPEADSVSVYFGNGDNPQSGTAIPLSKDENGIWSVTLGPLEPDLYEYKFNIDGLNITDPGNRTPKPQRQVSTSLILVPGSPPDFLDEQNVPHGTIQGETYYSKVLGTTRHLLVYTPPGYDRLSYVPLPVLYLYHGYSDTEYCWVTEGRVAQIMDNLLAQRKCVPMIVVIPDTHALNPDIIPATQAGKQAYYPKNEEAADEELFQDIVPMIHGKYHILPQSHFHAIAGLSLGGAQAITTGLIHSDFFGWIGAFSPAVWDFAITDKVNHTLANPAEINKRMRLFQIVTGRSDTVVGSAPQQFADRLSSLGIRHDMEEVDGSHNMDVWRPALYNFVQQIFH